MQLEVSIGSDETFLFPITRSRVTIGSSESSDLILKASGISRKHLVISRENDKLFVIDQGSTNGTFINEERITPGKKVEFTSSSLIRIGSQVKVSLSSGSSNIKAKTSKLPSKKEGQSNLGAFAFLILILMVIGGFYFWPKQETQTVIVPVETPVVVAPHPIEKDAPTPLEKVPDLMKDLKCTNDVEKYLCSVLPNAGVVQIGGRLNILVDGSEFFAEAQKILDGSTNETDLKRVAFLSYVLKAVPKELNESLLKEKVLNFVLFDSQTPRASYVLNFQNLVDLKGKLLPGHLNDVKDQGVSSINFTLESFQHE